MKNEKALEILKCAILMETRGQAFYKNVVEQSKNEDIKNIFTTMADEEKLHADFLSKQFLSLKHKGTPDKLSFPLDCDDSVVNMILSKEIKNQISAAGYEAAAISASIDMENKAVEIYSNFEKEAEDPEIKELFHWLANWEKGHVKILHDLDVELRDKIWFDNQFWPF
jgi:rubrerythrin